MLCVDTKNIVLEILCKLEQLQAWVIFFQFCDIENLLIFFAYNNKLVEFTLKIENPKLFPNFLLNFFIKIVTNFFTLVASHVRKTHANL
jgi:hypothetical protein